jgi:type IV pilus assembly protein PilC
MNRLIDSIKKFPLAAFPKKRVFNGEKISTAAKAFLIRLWFSESERIVFIKKLAIMAKAGISINSAIKMMEKNVSRQEVKNLVAGLRLAVEQGKPLARAMKDAGVFGDLAVNVVHIGESSGSLAQNLDYLSGEMQKRRELKRSVAAALIYPVFILIATVGIVIFLSVYIFPKILPVFSGLRGDLPWSTNLLIFFAALMRDYWWLAGIIFLAAVLVWHLLIRMEKAKIFFDYWLLRLPMLGAIFKNYYMANSCRALCLLLRGGGGIVASLELAGKSSGNLAYCRAFGKSALAARSGGSIGENMAKEKIFPSLAAQIICAGEMSGSLEDSLICVARMCEDEMNGAAKNLSAAIEPVLMVFAGLLVGFVATAIITPIYGITQLLQK